MSDSYELNKSRLSSVTTRNPKFWGFMGMETGDLRMRTGLDPVDWKSSSDAQFWDGVSNTGTIGYVSQTFASGWTWIGSLEGSGWIGNIIGPGALYTNDKAYVRVIMDGSTYTWQLTKSYTGYYRPTMGTLFPGAGYTAIDQSYVGAYYDNGFDCAHVASGLVICPGTTGGQYYISPPYMLQSAGYPMLRFESSFEMYASLDQISVYENNIQTCGFTYQLDSF